MDVLVELLFVLGEEFLDQIILLRAATHEIDYHVLVVVLGDFIRDALSVFDLEIVFGESGFGCFWRKRGS